MTQTSRPIDSADWSIPSPSQKVSSRSILRIQQLANELKEDLNTLPIFRNGSQAIIGKVLFAAIDPFHSGEASRWYNFRLCGTYDFPPRVRDWLTYDRGRTTKRFAPLFSAARGADRTTRASFDRFIEALFCDKPDFKTAFDQLLIALAVIPYRGVLLSLFEEAMELVPKAAEKLPEGWQAKLCCSFSGPLNKVRVNPCDAFIPSELFFVKEQAHFNVREGMDDLLSAFEVLLPFTRGEKATRKPAEHSPYPPEPGFAEHTINPPTGRDRPPGLSGFCVPAFDAYESSESGGGQWAGGFAGWVVAVFNDESAAFPKVYDDVRAPSWLTFTHLMRTFVRRVREAHMLDLLEEYADPSNRLSPEDYFDSHIHHIIGWRKSNPQELGSRELIIHFDPPVGPYSITIAPVSHDTRWSNKDDLPDGNEYLCKQFLSRLRLLRAQRGMGRDDTLEDISHEVKQVINALTGNWRLLPDAILGRDIKAYFDRHLYTLQPENAWLCPEPRLIESAARVIQLWTGSRAPLSFFRVEPRDLKNVFSELWAVVIDSALGVLTRKYDLNDPHDYTRFKDRRETIERCFNFDQIFRFTDFGTGPFPTRGDTESEKGKWCVMFKVLLAKFKDILSHAHPEKPRMVKVAFDGRILHVTIENWNRPESVAALVDLKLRALCAALYDTSLFSTSSYGENLLRRMAAENSAFLEIDPARLSDGHYKCHIRFFWYGETNSK